MCGKSQYVKTPDSKRVKTQNGPDLSEKLKACKVKAREVGHALFNRT